MAVEPDFRFSEKGDKKVIIKAKDIIEFWYSDEIKNQWFTSTPELDNEILEKYESVWEEASSGGLDNWSNTPEGSLALVIILDQFPLNMFRNQKNSFKTERKSVEIALNAIKNNYHNKIDEEKLLFLFMPLMHSENISDQDLSVKLFREFGQEVNIHFAEHHREIVRRFGRFPHRNEILGRVSTEDELNYMNSERAFKG